MPINIIRLEEAQRSLSLSPTHRIEKIDGQILNSSKKFLKTLRILKNCHRQIKFSSTSYIIVRNNKFFFKIPINKEKRVFISVRWLIKMYPRHTTFRTTFSPSREYDGKVWQAISLTRLVYTRLFDPRFLPELSHRYLSPCVASLFTVWQVGVPRWQRVHVTSYASRGVHRRRWIFERRAERKKGAWYDEARQQRREANLTRFSRANKNGGRGSIMECRKRIYLYLSSILRGNISPVFFPSLSSFFF